MTQEQDTIKKKKKKHSHIKMELLNIKNIGKIKSTNRVKNWI